MGLANLSRVEKKGVGFARLLGRSVASDRKYLARKHEREKKKGKRRKEEGLDWKREMRADLGGKVASRKR